MALPVAGKVLLDTNVFIDYLRAGLHEDWVLGRKSAVRFLSSVVLLELRLGAETPAQRRAVDRLRAAFPASRVVAPSPALFDVAGRMWREVHPAGGPEDRLGPMNDLLIALTARQIGAAVVTSNVQEFRRIASQAPGLRVLPPHDA